MWKLNNENAMQNSQKIKKLLENLYGKIPELKSIKVFQSITNSNYTSHDLILECEFNNFNELEIYQNHPLHQEVVAFIKENTNSRVCIEYEI